jgi:hypothetical protein
VFCSFLNDAINVENIDYDPSKGRTRYYCFLVLWLENSSTPFIRYQEDCYILEDNCIIFIDLLFVLTRFK